MFPTFPGCISGILHWQCAKICNRQSAKRQSSGMLRLYCHARVCHRFAQQFHLQPNHCKNVSSMEREGFQRVLQKFQAPAPHRPWHYNHLRSRSLCLWYSNSFNLVEHRPFGIQKRIIVITSRWRFPCIIRTPRHSNNHHSLSKASCLRIYHRIRPCFFHIPNRSKAL